MLYNPEKGSASAKLRIAGTVAHELAHFWFGDLGRILTASRN